MDTPEHIAHCRTALELALADLRASADATAATAAALVEATHTRWALATVIPAFMRRGHPEPAELHAEWQRAEATHTRLAAHRDRLRDRPGAVLPLELTWVRRDELPAHWAPPTGDGLVESGGRVAVVAMVLAEAS